MSTASKTVILVVFAVVTMLLLLSLSPPRRADAPAAEAAPNDATAPAPAPARIPQGPLIRDAVVGDASHDAGKFYFDVTSHSAAQFLSLLKRARMIYEQAPPRARNDLQVIMVLHGPDIEYFANTRYAEHQEIVDLAAHLDALEVFDFKACSVVAARLAISPADVPEFIEFVPYGPNEITRLEEAGFIRL